jgi:hypothetical protein
MGKVGITEGLELGFDHSAAIRVSLWAFSGLPSFLMTEDWLPGTNVIQQALDATHLIVGPLPEIARR